MGENKRLLSIHEQKFAKLAAFQANINVFQANTNASLKNLKTRVGQLALFMKNQSRNFFPIDTKKNPKDYMIITLMNGRELQKRKEDEKKITEKETKLNSLEMTEDKRKLKVHQEQPVEEGDLKNKDEVQAYKPPIPFPQRLQKEKMEE